MPRTPLAQHLANACSLVHEAETRNIATEQVIEDRHQRQITRREWLRQAAIATTAVVGAAALPLSVGTANAATAPRIVVVGGGLAGLTCAYRLQQAGHRATVYEAADRLGGRCWTLRGAFADGQMVERGGELIDQSHAEIRQLAQELGLTLDNLLQAEKNGTEPFFHFDGVPYSYTQATNDLKGIWQKLHRDLSEASYPTLYNSYTPRGRVLDHMSIVDWINESVPGGVQSKLGQLLDVAYNIEYGAESSEQSALNLLYLLGYRGQGQLRLFGPSNEKYHVRGGNDQIAARLAERLAGQIVTGAALVAIKTNSTGGYTLSFQQGARVRDVVADKVVLALPFTMLRSSVDISRAGFSARKRTAITQMGMGTNSKLHLQFTERHWETLGCNGDTFSDTGYQNTWDVSRAQAGRSGILVNYTGGRVGASFASNSSPTACTQTFLGQAEPVLPGIKARWNGLASLDAWPNYRWTKGSYSCWKVGQYTAFAGVEREWEGNCHFAGEHTSIDFQGYLNGAVESGERAADEIVADLSVKPRAMRDLARA